VKQNTSTANFSQLILIIFRLDACCNKQISGSLISYDQQLFNMENEKKALSRKKFLFWGIGITSLLSLPAFLRPKKKKQPQIQTVKMLTQDGRLVEVDISKISGKKEKIKNADIHTWIKKPGTF
jgi:hypothetical protein